MKYKIQVSIFLFTFIITLISIESLFITYPISTNITEVRKNQIKKLSDGIQIDYAIFGSSVTNEVVGQNPYIIKNIFNGTTVGATTLYGQYFLAQMLYKKKKNIKMIYLSFAPHMLSTNVIDKKSKKVERFFNDSFKEDEFVDILKNLSKEYTVENIDYFIKRRIHLKQVIKKSMKLFKQKESKVVNVKLNNMKFQTKKCKIISEEIHYKINEFSRTMKNRKMNQQYVNLLNMIQKFNKKNDTKIILILEAVPVTEYNEFVKSISYKEFIKLSNKLNIKFIDSNELIEFKDCYFRDQLHLNKESINLYKYFLSEVLYSKLN